MSGYIGNGPDLPYVEGWEVVHDEPGQRVRRIAVYQGWLYQVEVSLEQHTDHDGSSAFRGWGVPVFVPRIG